MIWLAWRNNRFVLLLFGALVIVLSLIFLLNGIRIYRHFQGAKYPSCMTYNVCDQQQMNVILGLDQNVYTISTEVSSIISPLLALAVGVFLGAPLVARERKSRTQDLVGVQSVTPQRWLVSNLGLITAVTIVLFALLSGVITWWSRPLVQTLPGGPGTVNLWMLYPVSGFVLPALAVTALMIGVAIGAFVPRRVLAMVITFLVCIACFIGLQITYPYFITPHVQAFPPETQLSEFEGGHSSVAFIPPGAIITDGQALVLNEGYTDASGNHIANIDVYCDIQVKTNNNDYYPLINQCVSKRDIHAIRVYQPAEVFWPLQATESGLLLFLSILLILINFWRIKRIAFQVSPNGESKETVLGG